MAPVLNEDKPTAVLEILVLAVGAILDTLLGADCAENLGTKLRVEKPSTSPKIQSQECLAMATGYVRAKDSESPWNPLKTEPFQSFKSFYLWILRISLMLFDPAGSFGRA